MEPKPEWLMPVLRYCKLEEFANDADVVSDVTDDYNAALEYLSGAGIVRGPGNCARFDLAAKRLTLHYHDQRGVIITGTIVSEFPLGLSSLIVQLQSDPVEVTT